MSPLLFLLLVAAADPVAVTLRALPPPCRGIAPSDCVVVSADAQVTVLTCTRRRCTRACRQETLTVTLAVSSGRARVVSRRRVHTDTGACGCCALAW